MKKACFASILMVVMAVAGGCFIQSFRPFYTENLVVRMPEINGLWYLTAKGEDDESEKYPEPWEFSDRSIVTIEKGIRSALDVTWFRIGQTNFANLKASALDENAAPNPWWGMHIIPVHSVCRVDFDRDVLRLTPLDGDWLIKKIQEKKIDLAMTAIDPEDNHYALSATPPELVAFLSKSATDAEAFPSSATHVFRRLRPEPAKK